MDNNKPLRLQVEVTPEFMKEMEDLMAVCGISTKQRPVQ